MVILGVDPGYEESGFCCWSTDHGVLDHGKLGNADLLHIIEQHTIRGDPDVMAIERFKSYGKPIGDSSIHTIEWSGVFRHAFGMHTSHWVYRREVANWLTGGKSKDSFLLAALTHYFGGQDRAIGTKRNPGVMYGLNNDERSALAVALTWGHINNRLKGALR